MILEIVCLAGFLLLLFALANISYLAKERLVDFYYEISMFFRSIKQEKK